LDFYNPASEVRSSDKCKGIQGAISLLQSRNREAMASAAEEVGVAHIVGVALGGNGATDAPSQQPVEAHVGALVGAVAEQLTGAVMAAAGPLAAASTAAASASMAVEPTSEDLEAASIPTRLTILRVSAMG